MDKKAFRQETLKKRSDIYSKEIDAQIIDNFIHSDAYKDADWMMLYVSFDTEIHTHALIERALAEGKHVVVPICNTADHTIILSEILNFPGDLEEGHYGILEQLRRDRLPCDRYAEGRRCRRVVAPEKLDLVLVPGMAFTEAGNRMGFGGGYYDRFLETIRPDCKTVALIREDFIYDEIPMEPHDKSVDIIITEDRVKACR